MKRHGNLWESIVDTENLFHAADKAARCKRFREDVLVFNYEKESQVFALQRELSGKTYSPGPYFQFRIYEPKERVISAAPYRDRVVHHALCNVIEPIFDRTFTSSCYANRLGQGSHRALRHYIEVSRRFAFVLKADVEKYFPSVDHAILKRQIRRKIKCPDTLWLVDRILDAAPEQSGSAAHFPGDDLIAPAMRRRGLPIGNLTSQLWANIYLNGLDHRLAAAFGGTRYLRYVDDIALFSENREELCEARKILEEELTALRLRAHPVKTQIEETRGGTNFLGFRILPHQVRVRQENLRRARRRLRDMQEDYREGDLSQELVTQSIRSWIAHLRHGDTVRLREKIFSSLVFTRN